jgi:hypothetical protein
MPPAQPPREKRTGRAVLVIVAGFALVGCLCLGGFGVFLYKTISSASAEPRAAVHAFVGDLTAGDANSAYEKLCRRAQGGYSRGDFATYVAGLPRPRGVKINGFSITDGTARIDATLELADGKPQAHTFDLVKESGLWRICGNPY